jgi:uridine monophosphate synthetase
MSTNPTISRENSWFSPTHSGRTSPRTNVLNQIALSLYRQGIIKFGEFTLRSGATSPIYFDLRQLISDPKLIRSVIGQYIELTSPTADESIPRRVCGVAYTGIPLATVYSQESGLPMILKRKEAKGYGTKQLIEGEYHRGDRVILLDDVITSGGSLLETAHELEKVGLIVEQILVLIDRRPLSSGRPAKLADRWPIRTVFTMENLLTRLYEQGIKIPLELLPKFQFSQRTQLTCNPVTRKLLEIIKAKQSNLVLSADVTTSQELLNLVDLVGDQICLLKTHMDLITDFDYDRVIPPLLELAKKHSFLILEDRKFADIGNTVKLQYTHGVHRIIEWADLVTVHPLMGEGIITALQDAINTTDADNRKHLSGPPTDDDGYTTPQRRYTADRGILLLAQLSNAGNLIDQEYTEHACLLAEKYPHLVSGVICQQKLLNDAFLHLTPGVNLTRTDDKGDQRYNSPDRVIGELESDLMIVGRGIYQKVNPLEAAKQYRMAGWLAYQKRVGLQTQT